jgi:hypothetical protein
MAKWSGSILSRATRIMEKFFVKWCTFSVELPPKKNKIEKSKPIPE